MLLNLTHLIHFIFGMQMLGLKKQVSRYERNRRNGVGIPLVKLVRLELSQLAHTELTSCVHISQH